VRHYECDAQGYVRSVSYLNYMQEAAFEAAAAAGFSMAAHTAMDRYWLVRETQIEHLAPLRYGDSVEVKTWVADFRRVRSRRAYELRSSGTGTPVAQATTDWVFLDLTNKRPASIPQEMMDAFFPEGPPEPGPPRERFPDAPPPPPGALRLTRQAEWNEIDPAQHVNNAVYLAYAEDCAMQADLSCGWPRERMLEKGFITTPRSQRIEYLQQSVLGDRLKVCSWLSDPQGAHLVRHCTITRAGDSTLLARARTVWETVDAQTREPIDIPTPYLSDLEPQTTAAIE
jgi:acyl-CoA thioester hydrolase